MGQASGKHAQHDDPLVDGGALIPQGVYSGAQDYDHSIVQRCIHERKLAPFYKSFEDEDPDAHTIAESYPHLTHALQSLQQQAAAASSSSSASHSRSASASSASSPTAAASSALSTSPSSPVRSGATSPHDHHHHVYSKTSPPPPPTSLLPHPLTECPICFLYYPSPLNFTRCCEQPICTECFVQIKRADPNHTNPPSSEPATCPYCMEANFGVVYRPPPSLLAKGGGQGSSSSSGGTSAAVAAAGNIASSVVGAVSARAEMASGRRRKSFGHTDPEVITIDMIRPDWEDKLRQAQAAIARRANRRIIMRQVGDRLIPIGVSSSRAGAELPEGIIQGPGGAIIITTTAAAVAGSSSSSGQQGGVGSGSGRWNIGTAGAGNVVQGGGGGNGRSASGAQAGDGNNALQTPPRTERGSSRSSRRRNQEMAYLQALGGQDMEEIMMMEAMRLSLLDHEEQQRRQAEAARREQSAAEPTSTSAPASAPVTDAPAVSQGSNAMSASPSSAAIDGSRDQREGQRNTEAVPTTSSETMESELQEAQREVGRDGGVAPSA
ncbi:hypothetical protein CF319_g7331 [Tilletia indica]|nr:hypothetical protein CF319_g7331 [Tilletia indica]